MYDKLVDWVVFCAAVADVGFWLFLVVVCGAHAALGLYRSCLWLFDTLERAMQALTGWHVYAFGSMARPMRVMSFEEFQAAMEKVPEDSRVHNESKFACDRVMEDLKAGLKSDHAQQDDRIVS